MNWCDYNGRLQYSQLLQSTTIEAEDVKIKADCGQEHKNFDNHCHIDAHFSLTET